MNTLCLAGLFVLLGIIVIMRLFLVVATVISPSMSPTLEIGDRILALKHWPSRWLRKGDIVLFWLPADRDSQPEQFRSVPLIKRIVGFPGDKVVSIYPSVSKLGEVSNNDELIVPKRHFFARGDIQLLGTDSFAFGVIPFENLFALMIMKLSHRNDDMLIPNDTHQNQSYD